MNKEVLDFINKEIEGCTKNVEFCKYKGWDCPEHNQRLINLKKVKEEFERLNDREKPKKQNDKHRCPKCNAYIEVNGNLVLVEYCWHCGQKLE